MGRVCYIGVGEGGLNHCLTFADGRALISGRLPPVTRNCIRSGTQPLLRTSLQLIQL